MKWPNFDIEHHRVRQGPMASSNLDGPNGAFFFKRRDIVLRVISSNGMGWEHVSVSVVDKKRVPTWEEMCWIKQMFWRDDECVIQFHPPASRYVNNHPYVLHMWKPTETEIPMPPPECVGFKELGVVSQTKARQIIHMLRI